MYRTPLASLNLLFSSRHSTFSVFLLRVNFEPSSLRLLFLNIPNPLKSALPSHLKPSSLSPNDNGEFARKHHGKTQSHMAFENTSTSVAASQMRNALNSLADTVSDPEEKKLFETEMDNFFALFRRYLNDKAKGNQLDWDRIAPPAQGQVVDYNELAKLRVCWIP
ncbi:hypothetical protein DID88_004969 [Monilinia fructigena]|uniref:Uncharacterized protein n=1 Tax=Monilinia fructigena TaxID=38457 RepID=A0A395ISN6_9HELO|nr:hypothetical protein DID88_004969 [Monilinia fructigena]